MSSHSQHHYFAGLDLQDKRVVVVGAGTVAQRRIPRLLKAGARIEVVSPEATPAVEGMAESGELVWHRRPYDSGDLDGAWYAVACTSDSEVNARVVAEAEQDRVFCVRADDAARGTAVTPAVAEHNGLLLGVLGGGDHRRSAVVKEALSEALRTGVIDEHVEPHEPGVALVGGGPGDPDLITVRGRQLLGRADVVITDRLAPRELLEELGQHVEVIDASKIPYGRAANQSVINEMLIDRARAGKFVVRLKGGDPYVYGRGFEELLACVEAGVAVTAVPGITSAFAAPAIGDVPVTHRGVAHEVVVVSGHVGPHDEQSLVDWPALARLNGTLVLMMAVKRIREFADVLLEHGREPSTPVAVVQEGTMQGQRTLRSTLDGIADAVEGAGIEPPAVVVIGAVAGLAPERPA
ncbi:MULTISPECIES: uroporphyrinogen-III C-methyltransferase [Actinopolyspora]|uniref:Uroporphyrin-III C-methyltransferase / precorrin-2 dehydrogenase / sirohydrochlorin ferrochelatase n=1 Tax=Actinopolyspora saharensis TaxID=995062 RepID=A0A1H1AXY6_9ACTN|nr:MULTISPECIES: uroporphyrinogen-III C-methyltransferase [Actinopolyspora]NHD17191.1 uroporphyrinogen-III C-methyltransferase [Actinopolyspora sp. BKK2]NHE76343.1 uroporphyrinogen-III C-methyltransferase [Actinopolyspora sp. BKK1]SDQ44557.1 uroporphyrin-III C-methyltransferase / precorrin-2 dehydrogenase / sirohydrochlorin ferrochelatase [Actinopolyspora saharensis]